MTIKKTQGVQTSNHLTCTWIQEVILDFKQTVKCPNYIKENNLTRCKSISYTL